MKQMKTQVLNLKNLKSQVPIRYLTLIYISNVQYYTLLKKNHQYNWSFGHQSQHEQYDDVCLKSYLFLY
jgi:hypothetical protein